MCRVLKFPMDTEVDGITHEQVVALEHPSTVDPSDDTLGVVHNAVTHEDKGQAKVFGDESSSNGLRAIAVDVKDDAVFDSAVEVCQDFVAELAHDDAIDEVQDMTHEANDEDWGFSTAPVAVVTEEDDWDFDSAPAPQDSVDPLTRFRLSVTEAAARWLGDNWREQLPDSVPMEDTHSSDLNGPSWKDELTASKWEDTDTYQKYQNTLKGMLGGHRAALLASVVKRASNEAKEDSNDSPSSGSNKPRRKERQPIAIDRDRSNPFT